MINNLIILAGLYLFATLWYSLLDFHSRRSLQKVYELIDKIRNEHPVVKDYLDGNITLKDRVFESFSNKRKLKRLGGQK